MSTETPVKVRIPALETLNPQLGKAREAARKATKRLAEHVAEAEIQNRGGYGYLAGGMVAKNQELQSDVRAAEFDARMAEQIAVAKAKAVVLASPEFKQLLTATIGALSERLAPFLRYEAVRNEAAGQLITLAGLPAYIAAEVRELKLWLNQLLKLGLVNRADLPPELRGMLPAGEVS